MRLPALILLACAPASVQAHTFGQPYTLPVPLWLYAWGAAAALLLSFLAAGYFMTAGAPAGGGEGRESPVLSAWLRRSRLVGLARAVAVAALLLTLATGFFGTRDPNRSFGMSAFWIFFVLVLTYSSALIGNLYELASPWRSLAEGLARLWPAYGRGRFAYPESLGCWPALLLYFGFIAWELLGWPRPRSLAAVLAGYTALNLALAGLFGIQAWFRHGELFAVLLRLVSLLAPVDLRRAASGAAIVWLRAPGAGVLHARAADLAGVLFVLFMLASTAFDAIHATRAFQALFWRDPSGLATRLVGEVPMFAPAAAWPWFLAWETLCLLLWPLAYLALYLLALELARRLARSRRALRELALDFAYTLLPIVFVYHAAHYFTLVLSGAPKMLSLLSDPFGWDWDLIGLRERFRYTYIPDLTWMWHVQVGLIVFGHVASVLLAHRVALRVFPGRVQAVLSQLPMLLLMVAFTVAGLWILAQPLQSTLVRG